MTDSTFLTRVRVKNYKSIGACDVDLGALSFLVGPNGAGKSNFLDALRFVADSLSTTVDHALRDRGGINEVRRRSGGHPNHFGLRVDFRLRTGASGHYAYHKRVAVVIAKSEFEGWFLAAAASLRGRRELPLDLEPPAQPEEVRGAKEWLSRHMEGSTTYSETIDQPAMAAFIDLDAARSNSPSFDNCWREIAGLLAP